VVPAVNERLVSVFVNTFGGPLVPKAVSGPDVQDPSRVPSVFELSLYNEAIAPFVPVMLLIATVMFSSVPLARDVNCSPEVDDPTPEVGPLTVQPAEKLDV
jgi:hypothetical protein